MLLLDRRLTVPTSTPVSTMSLKKAPTDVDGLIGLSSADVTGSDGLNGRSSTEITMLLPALLRRVVPSEKDVLAFSTSPPKPPLPPNPPSEMTLSAVPLPARLENVLYAIGELGRTKFSKSLKTCSEKRIGGKRK